ncbi:MAG: PEP/pyruvate-binding domain-containing protein [Candidatus Thorarchaeota archaeon]
MSFEESFHIVGTILTMYEADPIQRLADVDYSRAETFGERACSLSRLISKGYNVPQGVVITTKIFKRFLNNMPGTKRIDHLIAHATPENSKITAQEIQETIIRSPMPMQMANPIAEKIYKLLDVIKSDSVVIRTSAHVEDSSKHTCSGRGVFFHLKEIHDIIEVIKNCWASAFTADVLQDLMRAGLPPDNVRIAIIVEEMVAAKVSGVLSVKNDVKDLHIRANWGTQVHEEKNGICCDHFIVNEQKIGEPLETFVSYKEKISQIPPNTRHAVVVDNLPEQRKALSLNQQNITALVQLAKKIRRDFEVDYDLEFVFDNNGTLWLLDAIPRATHRNVHRIGTSVVQ